jgi:hypothetical protein
MSRKIIKRIVIPDILTILNRHGIGPGNGGMDWRTETDTRVTFEDEDFVNFLEEELIRRHSIAGEPGGECKELEFILEELRKRNRLIYEEELIKIIEKYRKIAAVDKTWAAHKKRTGKDQLFVTKSPKTKQKDSWADLNPYKIKKKKEEEEEQEVAPEADNR